MALCASSILHVAQWSLLSSLLLRVSHLGLAGRWAGLQRRTRTHRSWRAWPRGPSKCLGCRRSLAPAGHGAGFRLLDLIRASQMGSMQMMQYAAGACSLVCSP